MAANMPQMAGNNHVMMQNNNNGQRQLHSVVYHRILQTSLPVQGWQTGVSTNERLGKAMNLITNMLLAMPGAEWQKVATYGVEYEKKALLTSPDRQAYERSMQLKTAEMAKRREANAPNIQQQLDSSAARQAQAQAQQQMMMQAQMRMGQQPQQGLQQGFQHLQHPMQMSPMPQQPQQSQQVQQPQQPQPQPQQQQVGMAMGNPGMQQNPNQMSLPMGMSRQGLNITTLDLASLPPQERAKVMDLAQRFYQTAQEEQKQSLRNVLSTRLTPQQLNDFHSSGRDPVLAYYQQQAIVTLQKQQVQQRMLRQQGGMPQNVNPGQPGTQPGLPQPQKPQPQQQPEQLQQNPQHPQQQQQQHLHHQQTQQQQQQQQQPQHQQHQQQPSQQPQQAQPRQVNPGMMTSMGQQAGGLTSNHRFSSNLEIMNEQQAGFLAEQAGQMVVPASTGPGRNATPQPIPGMPPQNLAGGQPGPNQQPRPPQMGPGPGPGQGFNLQQVKMDQAHTQTQAQMKAQASARQVTGQPGAPTSQSPGMTTLNASMTQPPVAMGAQANGPRASPGNPGATLDPRFNQANNRPASMSGNVNLSAHTFNQMLNSIPVEQRQTVSALPPEKLKELMISWQEQRLNNLSQQQQQPKHPQMPGQQQQQQPQGQMGPFPGTAQPPPNGPGGPGPNVLSQLAARARMGGQNPQAQQLMDNMDIPPQVFQQLRNILPAEFKKWIQLKAWLPQSNLPPQVQQQLFGFQLQQFRQMYERKTAGAPNNQQGQLPGGQQGPNGLGQIQQHTAFTQNITPTYQANPQTYPVTQQDIEILRRNPKFANIDPSTLMRIAGKMKHDQAVRRAAQQHMQQHPQQHLQHQPPQHLQQQQPQQHPHQQPQPQPQPPQHQMVNGNATAPMNQFPEGLVPQPVSSQPDTATVQAPAVPQQPGGLQKSTSDVSNANSAAVKGIGRPAQNRPAPPKPSPAPPQKSLKRPHPDDAEAGNAAPGPNQQRPGSQAGMRTGTLPTQPTPEQSAALSPEQRQRFEQMRRERSQLQPSVEDINRLKALSKGELRILGQESMPEQSMTAEEKHEISLKIMKIVDDIGKISKGLGRWYAITHDDARAKMFFRTRLRLIQQFRDGEKMKAMRDNFSIRGEELDSSRQMLESMAKDLAANLPIPPKKGPTPGAPAQNTAAPPSQLSAPLNATNLEKQTQALNKTHNRSNSSSGQPPAAPTTSQPPLNLGAHMSPTGQPTYLNKPSVTQDTLQLPPSRKKAKINPPTSSTVPQASPKSKPPSPKAKRQPPPEPRPPPPPRPTFVCPETDCDMHRMGFANQEALDSHVLEDHIKPREDPVKFVNDSLAEALGLEPDGNPKQQPPPPPPPPPQDASSQPAKPDAAATPMSRGVSMKGQGSAAGSKGTPAGPGAPPDNKPTPGKTPTSKGDGNSTKPSDPKATTATTKAADVEMTQAPPAEDGWANSTIDPQDLMSAFAPFQPFAGGAISSIDVYRSLTPNDTPESIKDSGTSEPNSDISEHANIDIDLNWQPVEADLLLDLNNISVDGLDGLSNDSLDIDSSIPYPSWDDVSIDFSKPFQFDTSYYSMDTSGIMDQ